MSGRSLSLHSLVTGNRLTQRADCTTITLLEDHMSDVNYFIDGKQVLPISVWSQSSDFNIYRGTPSEIVLEMMGREHRGSVREALEQLVNHISQTRNIQIQLPWQVPDDKILANLFIYTLLQAGIIRPTPLA